MTLRDRARAVLPQPLYAGLRTLKHRLNLGVLYLGQANRFADYSAIGDRESPKQLSSLLIFLSHRIEKGLSHSEFRPCFGRQTLLQIAEIIHEWLDSGYPMDAFEFKLALSALKAYRNRHLACGSELPNEYVSGFSELEELIEAAADEMSGAVVVRNEAPNSDRYADVLRRRHSIREYGPDNPDEGKLLECIGVAMSAPSVCNRQSQRVTIVRTADRVKAILNAQGGWRGYAYPPVLLVITSSLASFVSSTERNEPYVDGGIFTMALLGAIESAGLAACPLNAMFEADNERTIRKLACIPEDEVMVCIVSVGTKPESVLCPRSARKEAADVVRRI